MRIKSVSQTLFRQTDSKLAIKLTANVLDGFDDITYYSLYEAEQYDYLSININAYISVQYKVNGLSFDRNQSVRIIEADLFQVNRKLREFYQMLTRSDMFTYYKSGLIECNARRDEIVTISLKSGGFLELEPGVILDANTKNSLPGVYLYINMKDQKTEISIDEFEYIMYKLSRINMSSEGMQLIIMKLLLEDNIVTKKNRIEKSDNIPNAKVVNHQTSSIFDDNSKIERVTVSTPIKTINSIDQLM